MEAKYSPYQRLGGFIVMVILMALLLSCKTTSRIDNDNHNASSHSKEEITDKVASDTKLSLADIATDTQINRQVVVETFDTLGRLSSRMTDRSVIASSQRDKSISQQQQKEVDNSTKKETDNTLNVDRSKTAQSNEVDNGFSLMVIAVCIVLGLLIILGIGLLIRKIR